MPAGSHQLRRVNFILAVLCLLAFGFVARNIELLPATPPSTLPASYAMYFDYPIKYVILSGHDLSSSAVQTFGGGAEGIALGDHFLFTIKYDASVVLLVDSTPTDWGDIKPMIGVTFGLFMALAGANLLVGIALRLRKSVSQLGLFAMAAFSLGGSTTLLTYISGDFVNLHTVVSWILILAFLTLLLAHQASLRIRALTLALPMLLPLFYLTASVVFGILLASIAFVCLIIRYRGLPVGVVIFYLVFWFAYSLYVVVTYSSTITLGLQALAEYAHQESRNTVLTAFLDRPDNPVLPLRVALALLVGSIPAIYLFLRRRIGVEDSRTSALLLGALVSLIPIAFAFFLWAGVVGVEQRLEEYGSLLTFLPLAVLLVACNSRQRKVVAAIAISCVVFSGAIVVINRPQTMAYASLLPQEEEGIYWLAQHSPSSAVIFTDNRLMAGFVVLDHLLVVGVTDTAPPSTTLSQLDGIYYGTSVSEAILMLCTVKLTDNRVADYLFFSKQMTMSPPGIKGYDFFFEPAPTNFTDKFQSSSHFSLVYENSAVTIFKTDLNESGLCRA